MVSVEGLCMVWCGRLLFWAGGAWFILGLGVGVGCCCWCMVDGVLVGGGLGVFVWFVLVGVWVVVVALWFFVVWCVGCDCLGVRVWGFWVWIFWWCGVLWWVFLVVVCSCLACVLVGKLVCCGGCSGCCVCGEGCVLCS